MEIIKEKRTLIAIVLALTLFFTAASVYALLVLKMNSAYVGIIVCGSMSLMLIFKFLHPDSLEISPDGIKWIAYSANKFISSKNISQISVITQTETYKSRMSKRFEEHTVTSKHIGILLDDVEAYLNSTETKKRSIIFEMLVLIVNTVTMTKPPDPRESLFESRQKYGYDILLPNSFGEKELMETLRKYYPDKVVR